MRTARKRLGALTLGVVVLVAGLGPGATGALAAGPSVTVPTATVTFLDSISFSGTATLTPDVTRVEIVLDLEGSTRSVVAAVATRAVNGAAPLSYIFETPSGTLVPNTDVTARFRLVLQDGSTVTGSPLTVHYDDTRFEWRTLQGEFVTVHWIDGGTSFGKRAARIADDAVRAVSTLLGVTERDPIDFYVYGDRTAFYDVIGPAARENVGGTAHLEIRTLFANIDPSAVNSAWVGSVIPHELTHLVFDTAVDNPYHYPPRWLNEGIANYLSDGYGAGDRSAVKGAAAAGSIMPLQALEDQFPTSHERFSLAYSESVSAVWYLVDRYGPDAMVRLVRSYAGGVSDDEAFVAALGLDVAGFEAAWLETIGAAVPQPYGPQAAPAGPLPSDWAGAPARPGLVANAPTPAAPTPSGLLPSGDATVLPDLTMLALVLAIAIAAISLLARRGRGRETDLLSMDAGAAVESFPSADADDSAPDEGGDEDAEDQ
ncbi:MAG: peptidase MA family metallohydrolase [Candidatus Limnocylindrales bacterium]